MPTAELPKVPDVAVPPLSGLVEVKAGGPVQVVFPGAKRLKVTVPVGMKPPLTVAVSEMELPTGPPAEGVVEIITASGSCVVDQILGTQADTFTLAIQQAQYPPPDGPAARRDPLEELAELRVMHDAGAIGEAEFQSRKQQLFGQI